MIKKVLSLTAIFSFLTASTAFAAQDIFINPPTQGYNDLGDFITNVIQLSFALALLIVLVMLVWGAFEWITSGGDKETVGKARGRIINALIGLAVLAVAFALATVGAQFLGFTNLRKITIPAPNNVILNQGQACDITNGKPDRCDKNANLSCKGISPNTTCQP